MNKEFVPYAEALELKQLGFDEPCFGRFYYKDVYPMLRPNSDEKELFYESGQFIRQTEETTLSPSYSQCFRWFRDNHGLYQSIEFNERYGKWVSRWCHINGSMGAISTHIKYEDAEDACLNKFIEFIKTKQ